MTFKQFFLIPVVIAILAFFLMLVDLGSQHCPNYGHYFVVWIAFQAWAMYFMAGCTLKTGVKVMLGYLGGAVASIAIMELGGVLGTSMPFLGSMAGPIAVLIIVVPVICSERVPMFDFVPAWFVGAGVFFGLTILSGAQSNIRLLKTAFGGSGTVETALKGVDPLASGHLDVMFACLFSCLVGVIFGIVTVAFRTKYEASLKLNADAPATAESGSEE
ncbi:MAG: DUF1097 domain-containing protein [Planctomycetes bacterium]|nr:DUF1097 domain-containing protein [Planctomycetota bacterium]